jgi:3-oxoacyl-[acyl-carrier protein] reductase
MVGQVVDTFGHIDVLVNNAGIMVRQSVTEISVEAWRRVIDVNLTGAFLCTKEVLRYMIPRRTGVVVNVSSIGGKTGFSDCAYAAAKAGLVAATKSIARDVAPYNIRVNAINPGLTETDIVEDMKPERKEAALGSTLMRRMGRPEEIANVVVFLASAESSYMTAAVVDVSGGRLVG